MKKLFVYLFSIMLMTGLSAAHLYAQTTDKKVVKMEKLQKSKKVKEAAFGVRGNCGLCKKTIEKAAMSVKGVVDAQWNKDKKNITVKYDEKMVKIDQVHQAIARAGYDTDKMAADPSAYKELPGCCKYDHNMKMNLK